MTPHIETIAGAGRADHRLRRAGRRRGLAARSISRSATANPMNSRWPRPRSRSISTAAGAARRASRSAASRPCRGARARPRQRSSGKPLDEQRRSGAAEAAFAERAAARAQRVQGRARQADAGARAACRPQPWRSDDERVAAPEPQGQYGPARAAHRRRGEGDRRGALCVRLPVEQPAYAFSSPARSPRAASQAIDLSAARAVPGVLDISPTRTPASCKPMQYSAERRRADDHRSRISARRSSTTARSSRWSSPTASRRRARRPTRSTSTTTAKTPSATFDSRGHRRSKTRPRPRKSHEDPAGRRRRCRASRPPR